MAEWQGAIVNGNLLDSEIIRPRQGQQQGVRTQDLPTQVSFSGYPQVSRMPEHRGSKASLVSLGCAEGVTWEATKQLG